MSSSQLSETEKTKLIEEMKAGRVSAAKKEIEDALIRDFVPRVIGNEGSLTAVDMALRVDRKALVVQALRDVADRLEKSYDT